MMIVLTKRVVHPMQVVCGHSHASSSVLVLNKKIVFFKRTKGKLVCVFIILLYLTSLMQICPFFFVSFRVRYDDSLKKDVCQITTATRLASSLKEAILYQLNASSFRKRKTYLDILSPKQTLQYQEWL